MKALLIIDWQKEYIDRNSDYYVGSNLEQETKTLNTLIERFRRENSLIIFVKHNETEGENFLEGSVNTELVKGLEPNKSDHIINKYQISSFYKTKLENILIDNNITELYLCGILTNLCVRSAISDAYDRSLDINVIEDLCIAFNPEIQRFTLEDLKETRPEINILSSSEI